MATTISGTLPVAQTTESTDPLPNIYSEAEVSQYIDESAFDFKRLFAFYKDLQNAAPINPDKPENKSITVSGPGGVVDTWTTEDMNKMFLALLSRLKAIKGISSSRTTKTARSKVNREYLEAKNQIYSDIADHALRKAAVDRLNALYAPYAQEVKAARGDSAVGGPIQIEANGALHTFILRLLQFYLLKVGIIFNGQYLNENTVGSYMTANFPYLLRGYLKSVTLQHLLRYVQDYNKYLGVTSSNKIINTFAETGLNARELITTNTRFEFPAGSIPPNEQPAVQQLLANAAVNFAEFNPTAVSSKLLKAAQPQGETADQAKQRRKAQSASLAGISDILNKEYGLIRNMVKSTMANGVVSVPNINRYLLKKAIEDTKSAQESLISTVVTQALSSTGTMQPTTIGEIVNRYKDAVKRMHTTKYPKVFAQRYTTEQKRRELSELRARGAAEYNDIARNIGMFVNQPNTLWTYEYILSRAASQSDIDTKIVNNVTQKMQAEIPKIQRKAEKGMLLSDQLTD